MPEWIRFNDLARVNGPIRSDLDRAIARVLDSGMFLRGEHCAAFEEEWAGFCGHREAVLCNSGTDSLSLAATAMEFSTASVQANTLPLTAIGLHRGGASVRIREINAGGRACTTCEDSVPVLLFGRLPSPEEQSARLFDAAHAHGWTPPAHASAAWSFYPTKTLGALGDGGAVTTNDSALADQMRELRGVDDRIRRTRQMTSRMDEIQAAVLRVKLSHLPEWIESRAEVAARYDQRLSGSGICLDGESFNHLYVIRSRRRDDLASFLINRRIETKIHWADSLHASAGPWTLGDASFERAARWSEEILSLPCYPFLSMAEVDRVCDAIEEWIVTCRDRLPIPE